MPTLPFDERVTFYRQWFPGPNDHSRVFHTPRYLGPFRYSKTRDSPHETRCPSNVVFASTSLGCFRHGRHLCRTLSATARQSKPLEPTQTNLPWNCNRSGVVVVKPLTTSSHEPPATHFLVRVENSRAFESTCSSRLVSGVGANGSPPELPTKRDLNTASHTRLSLAASSSRLHTSETAATCLGPSATITRTATSNSRGKSSNFTAPIRPQTRPLRAINVS
mmetsp:Transcript_32925/g.52605  ORF Transcript_32925/g.52605 Transcript_32925/m.52605 type:complete len:221 (+) Transcript_32925:1521-2183(+)